MAILDSQASPAEREALRPQRRGSRRAFLRSTCLSVALGGVGLATPTDYAAAAGQVRERTRASALKITDLRYVVLTDIPMSRVPIIRISTNQGIYGLGEVRDGASPRYALLLKSRLLGDPCGIWRGKPTMFPPTNSWGGKFRERIRLYADTPSRADPDAQARLLKQRLALGFTMLKMDLGIERLRDVPDALAAPAGKETARAARGMPSGVELTAKGTAVLCDHMARARKVVGAAIPLALDHIGPISVNSCIRLGKALERYTPAWLEDLVPWQHTAWLQQISLAVEVPILTGEDIYLKEGFRPLLDARAVDLIHPDLATAGGLLETKKIGDLAQEAGVGMVLHCAGSPVSFAANLHVAAATESFHSLEFHAADVPGWEDLVEGISKPIVQRGWAKVPEAPGLGVTLNERAARKHLLPRSGWFESTSKWDELDSHDQPWS